MLEEAAPSLSCSCWGDMGVSGAESAGRGNGALTKDPGRKSRVCIKTSVQVKLKEGLRELWSYLCWGGEGQGEKRKLIAGLGINGVAGSGWRLVLPEARHPLSPLCQGRQCPSPHLGLSICGASLCVMTRIQEDKPRAGVCQGGDQGGWLSQLAPPGDSFLPPVLISLNGHQQTTSVSSGGKSSGRTPLCCHQPSVHRPMAANMTEGTGGSSELSLRSDGLLISLLPALTSCLPLNIPGLLQPDPEYPV